MNLKNVNAVYIMNENFDINMIKCIRVCRLELWIRSSQREVSRKKLMSWKKL